MDKTPRQPKLAQPSPQGAPRPPAGMEAGSLSFPRGSRPTASPLGDSFSRALWIWAKGRVLASLRPPQGPTETLSTSSHVGRSPGEAASTPTVFRGLCGLPPGPSHTHQALHRELLLTHRKGLSLRSRPELLRVLEKRQGRPGAGPEPEPTPLQEALHRRQQKEQQQEETRNKSQDDQLEFMRIRERLRHQQPPQPPSP